MKFMNFAEKFDPKNFTRNFRAENMEIDRFERKWSVWTEIMTNIITRKELLMPDDMVSIWLSY